MYCVVTGRPAESRPQVRGRDAHCVPAPERGGAQGRRPPPEGFRPAPRLCLRSQRRADLQQHSAQSVDLRRTSAVSYTHIDMWKVRLCLYCTIWLNGLIWSWIVYLLNFVCHLIQNEIFTNSQYAVIFNPCKVCRNYLDFVDIGNIAIVSSTLVLYFIYFLLFFSCVL